MSGIAGIVDFRGRPVDDAILWQLCERLKHRGPDDAGIWRSGQQDIAIGFAHTRLALTGPSAACHQPVRTPDGTLHVVFDGAIYNGRELRDELRRAGWTFRSESDTEVVLAACGHWGEAALRRFNGMWALALFDESSGEGFLARDRFGIKPLIYAEHDQQLLFSSEMHALSAVTGVTHPIDATALTHFLRLGFVPHPMTIFEHVRKLPPGHLLRFTPRGVMYVRRWYHLPVPDPAARAPSYQEACAGVRSRIETAVRAASVAEVPVGVLLSGGVDSALLAAHLAGQGSGRVQTFSIRVSARPPDNEPDWARRVAEHFSTDHHAVSLLRSELLDGLASVLDRLGEPFADCDLLPAALMSRHVRKRVPVVVAADGCPELFGGSWRYLGHHYLKQYRRLPAWLRRNLIVPMLKAARSARGSPWGSRVGRARKLLQADSADPLLRHIQWSTILSREAEIIFRPGAGHDVDYTPLWTSYESAVEPALAARWAREPLNRILLTDLGLSLPGEILHRVDAAGMAYGLEVREPFLDSSVVEYVTQLPTRYKLDGRRRKRVLIDAHRDLLPTHLPTGRPPDTEIPMADFLRQELHDMFKDLVDRRTIDSFGWLDYDAVAGLYQAHCRRRDDHTDLLYALLVLCWWRRKHR